MCLILEKRTLLYCGDVNGEWFAVSTAGYLLPDLLSTVKLSCVTWTVFKQ